MNANPKFDLAAQSENSSTFTPEDELLLEQLVDDELNEVDRAFILTRLDEITDGWRYCALNFLESQAFRSASRQEAAENFKDESVPASITADTPRSYQHTKRNPALKNVRLAYSIAAVALLLCVFGFLQNDFRLDEPRFMGTHSSSVDRFQYSTAQRQNSSLQEYAQESAYEESNEIAPTSVSPPENEIELTGVDERIGKLDENDDSAVLDSAVSADTFAGQQMFSDPELLLELESASLAYNESRRHAPQTLKQMDGATSSLEPSTASPPQELAYADVNLHDYEQFAKPSALLDSRRAKGMGGMSGAMDLDSPGSMDSVAMDDSMKMGGMGGMMGSMGSDVNGDMGALAMRASMQMPGMMGAAAMGAAPKSSVSLETAKVKAQPEIRTVTLNCPQHGLTNVSASCVESEQYDPEIFRQSVELPEELVERLNEGARIESWRDEFRFSLGDGRVLIIPIDAYDVKYESQQIW